MSEVQAAEIWLGRGVFWGVQYHPEFGLHDVAAVIRRYGQTLLAEAFSQTLPTWNVMRPTCRPSQQMNNVATSPGGLASATTS
jgi:hypothetical protein